MRLRPLNTRVLLCHPVTLCRLTTEYSLNASVQTSVDDVSRADKKVGCHSKVCGIDAASIFSLNFLRTAIFFRILRIVTFYIIREEASIFAPQRIPFYKDPRVDACTVGKVRSSTVFMCVCSTFRPSDFLLFVNNGFVVGVRCQGNREPPANSATTPLSQRHSWLGSP